MTTPAYALRRRALRWALSYRRQAREWAAAARLALAQYHREARARRALLARVAVLEGAVAVALRDSAAGCNDWRERLRAALEGETP